MGRILLLVGGLLALIGLALIAVDKLTFLGRLPGDIVVRRPGFTLYLPLGTSILLSILLSLILWLFRR